MPSTSFGDYRLIIVDIRCLKRQVEIVFGHGQLIQIAVFEVIDGLLLSFICSHSITLLVRLSSGWRYPLFGFGIRRFKDLGEVCRLSFDCVSHRRLQCCLILWS